MRIVWDEPKRARNLARHQIDFADVELEFDFAVAALIPGRAAKDGRARHKAVGRFRGRVVVVVFSFLGTEGISIISVRPANRRERSDDG